MKKKISRRELIELRKKEKIRKELELDIQQRVEWEYKDQENMEASNRLKNIVVGAAVGFGFFQFLNYFFLGNITSIIAITDEYKLIYTVLQVALIVLIAYLNMRSMGKFGDKILDFVKSFFR